MVVLYLTGAVISPQMKVIFPPRLPLRSFLVLRSFSEGGSEGWTIFSSSVRTIFGAIFFSFPAVWFAKIITTITLFLAGVACRR